MPWLTKHLDLGAPLKISSWRKAAIGTWRSAGDPSVYGTLEVDVRPALAYLEKLKQQTSVKLTLTHFVGKAIAQTLEKNPEINCILRFGRLYPRKNIDLFFQVASDMRGEDLSGTTVRNANHKSIPEIAQEMQKGIREIRHNGDPAFRKTKTTLQKVPGIFLHSMIQFLGFFMYSLNLWSPLLGSPKDPFGSIMITSVGALGIDAGFAPLVPYSRVPILLAVGVVKDTPIAINGKVEIAPICRLFVTFDHRLIDGVHASHLAHSLKAIFENPERELCPKPTAS